MRPILVVVSAPSLQLFAGVGKRQEPVGVHALRPEAPAEGLDKGALSVGVPGRENDMEI